MATITLTISNAVATRFVTAIGYSATLPNGNPNPTTSLQAAKDWIANDIKAVIKNFESPIAAQAAIAANSSDVEANVIIT